VQRIFICTFDGQIIVKDFTLEKYECLLTNIKQREIPVYNILEYKHLNPKNGIILRHDVDRKPFNALQMAILEDKFGYKSTYYFRITRNSFNTQVIEQIYELGHEIGYHYEDLSLAGGNYQKAIRLFEKHLQKFEPICSVKTIAMHGRPYSKHDNKDLWQKYDLADFGIEAEVFLSFDYSDIYYFTDTGRSWSNNSANLRDKVNTTKKIDIHSTDELMEFITKNRLIAIVAHPERWASSKVENLTGLVLDSMKNLAKKPLKIVN